MAALLAVAACSAPVLLGDLSEAERLEKAGEHEAALAQYVAAQQSCRKIRDARVRRETCASAYLLHAELLVTLNRKRDAASAYADIPKALSHDPAPSSEASFRAGRLYLELGDRSVGYEWLWSTVARYPGEAFAADALAIVVRAARQVDARRLATVIESLLPRLGRSAIGDNLLYALADLYKTELADPKVALGHYDAIPEQHKQSGLIDESYWFGADIARKLGDSRGAVKRLRKLLATREVAFGAGSYFSVKLDNAQLLVGVVLRDDLEDYKAAISAFKRLPKDYPASILRDDALFELAKTRAVAGDKARACAELAKLGKDWPDSKYELEKAPALRAELGCR